MKSVQRISELFSGPTYTFSDWRLSDWVPFILPIDRYAMSPPLTTGVMRRVAPIYDRHHLK